MVDILTSLLIVAIIYVIIAIASLIFFIIAVGMFIAYLKRKLSDGEKIIVRRKNIVNKKVKWRSWIPISRIAAYCRFFLVRKYIRGFTLEVGSGNNSWCRVDILTDVEPIRPKVLKMSAEKLDFKDNTFDTIICYDVIEHIKDDRKAMKEMARVLKVGGHLIITFLLFMKFWSSYIDEKAKHYRRYSIHEMYDIVPDNMVCEMEFDNRFCNRMLLTRGRVVGRMMVLKKVKNSPF